MHQHTLSYRNKTQTSFITILEPEYLAKYVSEIVQKKFHFIPNHPKKTRLFYEYILVGTDTI